MATITISGNDYFSYATVAEADEYLVPDPNYATWSSKTADQKGAYLIQATRLIDSQEYIESADTQSERALIENFKTATILIAVLLSTGETSILGGTVSSGSTETKRLKAGSAEIEYFRNLSSLFASSYATNWPPNIYALLKDYLKSNSSGIGLAASFGTCGKSSIQDYGLINT